MKIIGLLFIFFCSSCYSADWGTCKLSSYFYSDSIKGTNVFFHGNNKLSIDFEKEDSYWGVSLFKLNKDGPNVLLKRNSSSHDGLSMEKLVHKNYVNLLEQEMFHMVKKTEGFKIPTVPETSGYSMEALFDPELDNRFGMMNFSIAVQEYKEYILFTKITISTDGELPSVDDVKEVVIQFRNSCSIYDTKA